MKRLGYIATFAMMVLLFAVWNVVPSSGQVVEPQLYDFDTVPHHWNVRLVGRVDCNPFLKFDIQEVNGKWYLYVAHYWNKGWSVIDVTHPQKPKLVKYIPGFPNTDTTQIAVADGIMITSLEKGMVVDIPDGSFEEGVLIWSLADPKNPQVLSHWKTGRAGTHRVTYYGGRYAHVSAGMPGYNGNIYVILDVSNPSQPIEAGRWWVPGQKVGESGFISGTTLHGAMADGNVAYLAYQAAGFYMLDISDVSNPKLIGRLPFSPPFKSSIGVHTAFPLPGTYDVFPYNERKLAWVNSEATSENCEEPLNHASIVDITDMTKPYLVSTMPVPVPPRGAPYNNYCEKLARFGPHNANDLFGNPFVQRPHNLAYLAWFNAGLRIYDISDPHLPTEVGYYIPSNPEHRFGPNPRTALVTMTEYPLVDTRGYIYLADKNQGLWIVQYTGRMKDHHTGGMKDNP